MLVPCFIYPENVKGWNICRTFPGNVCPADPIISWDLMEVWGDKGTKYAGFVEYNSSFKYAATIFKTYEEAVNTINELKERYGGPGIRFAIIPYPYLLQ